MKFSFCVHYNFIHNVNNWCKDSVHTLAYMIGLDVTVGMKLFVCL
jgi:hypothetical protein